MAQTVFERCGGFATVSKIVLSFYDRMLDSPLTSPYFADIDMKRLIDHQTKFFAALMGGPASYTNEHLDHVHARLGITGDAFDEALLMMRETLEDHDVEENDIRAVEDEMRSRPQLYCEGVTVEQTQPSDMPDSKTLLQLAKTLNSGIAIVEPDGWTISFENANFFKWFPPGSDADEPLPERLPGFNADRARSRMEGGRPYSFETQVKVGNRDLPLSVELRPLPDNEAGMIVVECVDRSKQKQAEYMLESYSAMAEKNARDLEREKDRVERLLLNIMPKSVYEEMKDYGTVTPQVFPNATVLMIDFVGHTDMEISKDPAALVTALNDIFTVFDRITELFDGERIRTIGDAYVAVSGVPIPTPDHAANAARIALRIQRYMERRNAAHAEDWLCRIGINTGPVIGSLVGIQKYVYDIFGPGISMAARMEALSEPMQITISDSTYQLIKDDFLCTDRGEVEVKGFGECTIYSLDREMPHLR